MIKLDPISLKSIIGSSKEVTVYGLHECYYNKVMRALEDQNYTVNCWSFASFPLIPFDELSFIIKDGAVIEDDIPKATVSSSRSYKSTLTSLIIENYKRVQKGDAIIPLLFCVELETNHTLIPLDIKKIAASHRTRFDNSTPDDSIETSNEEIKLEYKSALHTDSHNVSDTSDKTEQFYSSCTDDPNDFDCSSDQYETELHDKDNANNPAISLETVDVQNILDSSVTEKELRRSYKMYAEATPEIKDVIEKTYKFVRLKQDPNDKKLYRLEEIPPFWKEKFWNNAWQNRTHYTEEFPKQNEWRKILASEVANIKAKYNFFQPANNVNNHAERTTEDAIKQLPLMKY